jgi:DNA-binding response OmpR family regulator
MTSFSILIVEDDEDDRFFIDDAFRQIGYNNEVKKFINGEFLFKYLEQIDPALYPSLIVLDGVLPKMDASDILSKLKKSSKYKDIKVVIYSTYISPRRMLLLKELGAYECITKGSLMSELVDTARRLKEIAESG